MPPPGTVDYSRRVVVNGEPREFATAEEAQAFLATVPERLRDRIVPDSEEAHAARVRRREFGERPLEAGAVGAVREATLGLSDVAAVGVGGEETADYLAGLEEANPEASAVGRVVGGVAPILASGGGALAGRGLLRGVVGAVGAPTRIVAGLAERAGAGVARGLLGTSTGAGARIATRALGVGLEGAIEGAASEAGSMLSEAALGTGDPELTAEMALARLGTGALLGGSVGSVLGGAGATVAAGGRALREASADVLGRGWRATVGTELSPAVARTWAAIADVGDEGAVAIRRFSAAGPDGARLRRLIERGDGVYGDGEISLREAMNVRERAFSAAGRYWREGLRADEMEGLVDASLFERQAASARALAADMRDRVEALATDFRGSPVGGHAAGLGRSLDRRLADIELAIARGDGARSSAEVNAALNGIKRDVDALVARSRGMGPTADALGEANNSIRRTLEDSAVWGERAAVAQREINEAFSRLFTTRGAYARRFLEEGGTLASRPDWNPFDVIPQADSARMAAFLRGVGTTANDTAEATFRETNESMALLLDVMERNLALDPASRAAVTEARAAHRALSEAYDTVRREAADLNQWRHLEGNRSLGRAIVGGAIGTAAGGPLGGLAATALTNPAQVIRGLGLIERWTQGTASDIGNGLRRFTEAGRRTAREGARRARTAVVSGSVRAYLARVERLEEESSNPSRAIERVSAATEGMHVAPRTRDAMVATAIRANGFLNSVRPRNGNLPGEVRPGNRPPGTADISRFMRMARVVDDPMSIIDDLENGEVSPDSVAALQQVYPRLYEQIRIEAMRHVAESETPISHESLVSLGILLGIPTTPSLHPDIMRAMQASYALPAPPPPSARRPPRLAEGLQSGAQSVEARGA